MPEPMHGTYVACGHQQRHLPHDDCVGIPLPPVPDLFGPFGLDLDGACPSCGSPLDGDQRGGYCEECDR